MSMLYEAPDPDPDPCECGGEGEPADYWPGTIFRCDDCGQRWLLVVHPDTAGGDFYWTAVSGWSLRVWPRLTWEWLKRGWR